MFSGLLARGVLTGLLWAGGALALAGQAGHATAGPGGQPLPQLRYAALQGDDAKLWQFSADPAGGGPQATALPHDAETPLGSVWKLFVYSYLVSRRISTPDYTCHGNDAEEVYCCTAGNSFSVTPIMVLTKFIVCSCIADSSCTTVESDSTSIA